MSKIAVVTGTNGAVGNAISNRLETLGYNVIRLTREDVELTDENQIKFIVKLIPYCDVLVNCASAKAFPSSTYDEFDISMANNAKSILMMTRELKHLMTDNSIVVNISSVSGLTPGQSLVYSASKAAVESITKSLALELAPKTRVISVAPSFIEDTSRFNFSDDRKKEIINSTPLHRICTTNDVTNAVEACITLLTFSTGTTIVLDGGRLL